MSSYVYVSNPNGTTYVYENTSYWDKDTKKTRHKRVSVGHLDPITKKLIPNRKKGDAARSRSAASYDTERCSVLGIGIKNLLDKAVSDIGLMKLLASVFPEDWNRILTCAYYLVSEGGALAHVEKWQGGNKAPYEGFLTSQRISELLRRITPSLQQDFFIKWISQNQQKEFYAMDITSVSSYSDFINFVRWGYNRDGEDLPQINLLMVTGIESHLPLYYRMLPGSLKDVNSVLESLKNFKLLDSKLFHFVMDKGFYSEPNIDAFYDSHKKFLMGVPFTTDLACEAVEEYRDGIKSHHNFCCVYGDELYAITEPMEWDGHRFYRHVYYDSYKAALDEKKFDHELYCCKKELLSGKRVKGHESYYKNYFIINETPVRGIKVEFDEDAIAKHKKNRIGWFVLVSNDIKDKVRALEVYRSKDAVEKCFDDMKNDLDMKRLRMHTEATVEGRIFIQFIALLITTHLKQLMNDAGWFKDYNLQEVLNEMKTIREVSISGRRKKYKTELTSFQKKISELYGLAL